MLEIMDETLLVCYEQDLKVPSLSIHQSVPVKQAKHLLARHKSNVNRVSIQHQRNVHRSSLIQPENQAGQ